MGQTHSWPVYSSVYGGSIFIPGLSRACPTGRRPSAASACTTGELRCHDPDWRIHREFFNTVTPYLSANGVIILQENTAGSTTDTFRDMIAGAGLAIVFSQGSPPQRTADHRFYYIGIMRKDAAPPSWARPA